jgi:beta-phosphoglucomutase
MNENEKAVFSGNDLGEAFAAIFDMDGTLVDNTPYHYKAWQQLFKKYNMPELSKETYLDSISGVPILNTLKKYFGDSTSEARLAELAKEKKQFYEADFLPHLKAINGLENFLAGLKDAGVKIALATSSTINDVDFIFGAILIRQYFDAIVIGSMVREPKPSPQIFLKAAECLSIQPDNCVVFEDSIAGLKAGNNAGMKVVGITTSHSAETIDKLADLTIDNYLNVSLTELAALFDKNKHE